MQIYHITIPDLDIVDEPMPARSAKSAALKLLSRQAENLDFESPMEIHVHRDPGRRVVFEATALLSFRLQKVG